MRWAYFRENVRGVCRDVAEHFRIAIGRTPARPGRRLEAVLTLAILPAILLIGAPALFKGPYDA